MRPNSSFALKSTTFPLRESLVRLNLCSDGDFRRCRRHVRRLARGIPAFDFVWIDALLHAGVLTPFQAKVLETSPPEALRVGPCVLLDRMGRGDVSETYLARTPGGFDQVVLKRLRLPADEIGLAFERLRGLIERSRGLDNPFVIGPHFVDQNGSDLIVLSRHAAGPNCRELLIRRGRFPVDVVGPIARQLASGLAALESRASLHGQIQLPNVRLTGSGQAVLVDAGIGQSLERGLLLRGDVPPETYEGTAPELIGTGKAKTTATEIYAFGCLIWQLLAGRPPFPTGDPLGKLAAHQSRAVPDIREFAPDTPLPLAEAVRALTQQDASRRPASFAEVSSRFGAAEFAGHPRLARFRREFATAAPLEKDPVERERRVPAGTVLIVLLVLAGTGLSLFGSDMSSRLLWLRTATSSLLSRNSEHAADKVASANHAPVSKRQALRRLRPLPRPNADGIVLLDKGPYEAGNVSYVGDLAIRGSGDSPSVVIVQDRPVEFVCRKFRMERVVFRTSSAGIGVSPRSLVAIRSQEVLLDRCSFSDVENGSSAAIVWTAVNARDPDAGRIRLSNTVFVNAGAAVLCASTPGRLEVDNCLKIGGALFDLRGWPTGRDLTVSARHLTLRNGESFCRVQLSKTRGRNAQVRAALDESVFDLTGRQATLVLVTSDKIPFGRDIPMVVTGRGSVIRTNVPILAWTDRTAPGRSAIELSSAVVEGLAVGEFQFVGKSGPAARESALDGRSLQIPRRSDVPPGIVAERLPFAQTPSALEADSHAKHDPRPLAN
jgi:eukaryotic-like serine/threonine-protein kinase